MTTRAEKTTTGVRKVHFFKHALRTSAKKLLFSISNSHFVVITAAVILLWPFPAFLCKD